MRSLVIVIAIAGTGGLASSAGCARREPGPPVPSPVVETAAPVAVSPPPSPSPPARDSGTTEAAAPDAGQASAPASTGGRRHPHAAPSSGRGVIGKVKVQGSVPRGDVDRVLRDGVPRLRACRGGGVGGQGEVNLELTIGDQGWATLAEVKRTTLTGGDPELCIVKALRTLRFPRPSDGKDTKVSFVLQLR
jgi:hypothetical protein